jgi:hypothetical protein
VERVLEGLVEVLAVADDLAAVEVEGKTDGVGVGAQLEERVAAGAGEDGGGEQGEPAVVEQDVGPVAAGRVLAFAKEAEAAAGKLEDVPRARRRRPRRPG